LGAAAYTGVLIILDDRTMLKPGYFYWLAALVLMLLAPVLSRLERIRLVAAKFAARKSKNAARAAT